MPDPVTLADNSLLTPPPFFDKAAATYALDQFFAEVAAARKRHRIETVVVLCEVDFNRGLEECAKLSASVMAGDPRAFLPVLASALGSEKRRAEAEIQRMLDGTEPITP